MKNNRTNAQVISHKANTLSTLDNYITTLATNDYLKADKFLYWLEDYVKFLNFEDDFNPKSLRRYKRGEVIKAHLGYNIGSEEGGLHYCVVVDNENHLSSNVITVVPLTSLKKDKNIDNLRKGEVYLGTDLKDKVLDKCNSLSARLLSDLNQLTGNLDSISHEEATTKLNTLTDSLNFITKIQKEFNRMKDGSIALVGQITTISKIRIYDPKTNRDVLSNIKLSAENLDKIDNHLKNLFTKTTK